MFANMLCAEGVAGFDVTIFLYIALILASTKILGIFCRKLGLPQVVGALIAGILIGPVFKWVVVADGSANQKILEALSQIGVLMIMFSAGLDTNLREIKKNGIPSLVITTLGVVVPLIFGFFVGWGLALNFAPLKSTQDVIHALFYGVLLTATSVGITVEVLKELGKLKGKVGSSILSAAILDDIIGIVILSIAISINNSGSGTENATDVGNLILNACGTPNAIGGVILSVVLFFVVAVVCGIGIHYAFKWLSGHFPVTRRLPIFGLVICFLFAWASEHFFGVAAITGAFVTGIVMSNMPATHYVERKIDISSYMIFSPIFFAYIGITMDFSTFNMESLGLAAAFVVAGLAAKVIGCGAGAFMCKFSFKDSLRVGFGMMARGEVVLIVAQKGIAGGIVDSSIMFPVVLLIAISSFMTPIMLKLLYRKENASPLQFDGIEPPPYEENSEN